MRRAWPLALCLAACSHAAPLADREGGPSPAPQAMVDLPDAVRAPPPGAPLPPPSASPPPLVAAPPPPPPKPRPNVRIVVRSAPSKAFVHWGKKKLGRTPVTFERPLESGPVDLVVRAEGYFPFHTRAYTFRNESLSVHLTKLADRQTLFGAKREVEPPPVAEPPSEAAPAPSPQPE